MNARDVLQMLALSAVWGCSFILIKIAGGALPPTWVALGRLAFGSAFLWAVLSVTRRRLPPRAKLVPVLLVALFNNAIPFTFFAWGEQSIPSSLASILNATTPLWSTLIALLWSDLRPTARTVAGVLLGFLGVGLAVSGNLGGGFGSPLGAALVAFASLGYAIATTIAKRSLGGTDPIGMATAQLSGAGVMILPVAALSGVQHAPPLAAVGAVAVLGVLGSGVAYLLYYGLLQRVSPTQVLAVTYLLPVWGLFWGRVAGEPVGWTSLIGVVVILAGLTLLNSRGGGPGRRAPARPDAPGDTVASGSALTRGALDATASSRLFVEVLGAADAAGIRARLPRGVDARVWPYARLGDFTLELRFAERAGAAAREDALARLAALGLRPLAWR